MTFLKKRGKVLLTVSFFIFLIVQQLAVSYGRSYRSPIKEVDKNRHDYLAIEVNQLGNAWRKAAIEDLITSEKIANHTELELALDRLKEAKIEIQNSQKRVEKALGEKSEFFQKVHAYYHESVLALTAIVDFLLAKKGEYSVNGNEINFENETDGERFGELMNQLFYLYREKQSLDTYILHYNLD